MAIRYGDASEVERLLALGANPNGKNRRGDETALLYAVLVRAADVVRVLLAHGATDNGRMPLEETVAWPRQEDEPETASLAIARLLLEQDGDSMALADKQGHPLLIAAAAEGDVLMLRLFLDYGAGIHAHDALQVALRENHHEAAEVLRKAGASG